MCEYLEEVLLIEKKEQINEKELFDKMKEFLDKETGEYPSFALTTMIMDSFISGASICKVTRNVIEESPNELKFLIF
ncbi:hypothetical protein KAT36_00845 [Candidatus Pacearchaeota archaeon]|nr:hypothetical protein [Candidatus Pacearchaeota archaeon]